MGGRFENLLSFRKMAGPPSQVINDQPLIVAFALISFPVFAREAFGSVKTGNFCVQEFGADREYHELTWQGGKLGVL